MIKSTVFALAASGLSILGFSVSDPATEPRPALSQEMLHFDQLNMDALLYAPVIDDLNNTIGHIDEIIVAANGAITGFVVSEYDFLPIFPQETIYTAADASVFPDGTRGYRVQVAG